MSNPNSQYPYSALFPYVTPNEPVDSESIPLLRGLTRELSLEEEFDLIAPVVIYFLADGSKKRKAAALKALQTLKSIKHPILDEDDKPGDIVEERNTPDHFIDRYNALMMAIVHQKMGDDAVPYIDEYGAFAFRVHREKGVLSGDDSGIFAFYEKASAVQERLNESELDAEFTD